MKIGITERGDASLDFSWVKPVKDNMVDAAIIITKNITSNLANEILQLHNMGKKLILHCTCTGWGNSYIEPNVPYSNEQLENLKNLINRGFPKKQCVLRIDPIIPTDEGLLLMGFVIKNACKLGLLPDMRIRVSIYDEYRHVKKRLLDNNVKPFYGDKFYAPENMQNDAIEWLRHIKENFALNRFEACAEKGLADTTLFEQIGCVSQKDIDILNIRVPQNCSINPQNRPGCKCLSCKTELLNNKKRCPYKCLYCYWHD